MSLSTLPPNINHIFSNRPSISISCIEDLEGKSIEEIWLIILFLENNNLALVNTIEQLNGTILKKDKEANILRDQLSDIASLKNEVATLLKENNELKEKIEVLENRLMTIEQGLSAREIGSQADMAALKRIFPNATKKPFSIRSLANLVMFIEDPAKAMSGNLCPPGAAEAWDIMNDIQKNTIKSNLKELLSQYPSLLFSIKILKSNWKVAHTITSISEAIEHFRNLGDDTMVEAIELCAKILASIDQ